MPTHIYITHIYICTYIVCIYTYTHLYTYNTHTCTTRETLTSSWLLQLPSAADLDPGK